MAAAPRALRVTVLFPDAFPRLHLLLSATLVRHVKAKIHAEREEIRDRRLRLIYRGRLIEDDIDLCDIIQSGDDAVLHCSIAEADLPPSVEDQEQLEAAPTGFDRLRAAGLSEADIENLRADFAEVHGQTDEVEVRQLEERWMDEGGNDSLGEPPGIYEDILLGTLVGFFGGLISILFLRETNVFSKRTKLAVVAGFLINICFSVIRL